MPTSASALPITGVTAFVDWNAQLLLAGIDSETNPENAAEAAFRQTTRRIARCLADVDPMRRFRVSLRLYHGWHKGYEPTPNRRAAQLVVARADYSALSQRPNVIFSPDVAFGDRLLSALDRRLHPRLAIHLPNTLRRRRDEEAVEKMVDTALAADVVASVYRDPSDWVIVVTEDDDLIPSIYVAEAAFLATGAKALLLRKRPQASMVTLDNLLVNG